MELDLVGPFILLRRRQKVPPQPSAHAPGRLSLPRVYARPPEEVSAGLLGMPTSFRPAVNVTCPYIPKAPTGLHYRYMN